jgi:hypothetical protein
MEIERITLAEYYKLEDTSNYDFAMKFAHQFTIPENIFKVPDLEELEFGFIKNAQLNIVRGDMNYYLELFHELTGLNPFNLYLDEFTRQLHYIKREFEKLSEKESKLLISPPSEKEQRAGLERFDGLGAYMQERELANNDITKLEAIRKTKYKYCFVELYTRKQERDFNKAYSKLK